MDKWSAIWMAHKQSLPKGQSWQRTGGKAKRGRLSRNCPGCRLSPSVLAGPGVWTGNSVWWHIHTNVPKGTVVLVGGHHLLWGRVSQRLTGRIGAVGAVFPTLCSQGFTSGISCYLLMIWYVGLQGEGADGREPWNLGKSYL